MNVFIVAVCVNLIIFVDATGNINFDTILKILKGRRTAILKPEDIKESVETMPIMPGFYLQKPKEISKSLFRNPQAWPNFVYMDTNSEDTNKNTTTLRKLKSDPRDDYLTAKIMKAVKNLNKYRESQRNLMDKAKDKIGLGIDPNITQSEPVVKLIGKMLNGIKKDYQGNNKITVDSLSDVSSKKDENLLVEKLLTQILKEIRVINSFEKNQKYKKQQNWDRDSKNAQKLGNLLKNLLIGNVYKNNYLDSKKYAVTEETEESEDRSQNTGDYRDWLMEMLIKANQPKQYQGNIGQKPPVVFIQADPSAYLRSGLLSRSVADFLYGRPHSTSFHNNDFEMENHAKESLEVNDVEYESTDPDYQYHTRRNDDDPAKPEESNSKDKGSESDMEKNPGNPYTIHKNKYKQNWVYNHFMDGDHMNINPFGPQFASLGPSGPELFFGRKWWYYNQDDYKPMG